MISAVSEPDAPPIVITIDGPAASGKSSTAAWVARELGYRHVDSGALYREETARRLGVTDIRSPEVTAAVSKVAQIPEVRAQVNAAIHAIAAQEPIVVDGRDMGNVVFPNASLKIFLVADPWERARRRLLQRHAEPPTDDQIAEETKLLVARDAKDATQTVQARDAILLDTTYLSQSEQVHRIVAFVRAFERKGGKG
jgi:cytidylate kinase